MPCLVIVIALAAPRLVIALLWFCTQWFTGLFPNALWPVLGFVFLPTALLWYLVVQHWFAGQWSAIPIAGMVLALLVDLSPLRGGWRGGARE